jgi:hypothetical protein
MSALMAEGLAAATASAEELWLVQAVVLVWRLAGAVRGLALVAELAGAIRNDARSGVGQWA